MDTDPDNILIETPLRISFGLYTLFIYNCWKFLNKISNRIDELKGKNLASIRMVSQMLELWFNSGEVMQIDMSDNGYVGPEALVLNGPVTISENVAVL
jgi:hypothetical protein